MYNNWTRELSTKRISNSNQNINHTPYVVIIARILVEFCRCGIHWILQYQNIDLKVIIRIRNINQNIKHTPYVLIIPEMLTEGCIYIKYYIKKYNNGIG